MSEQNLKILIILLLVIILLIVLVRLSRGVKIKQTRYRSDSGDLVKSRAELIIANWLFYHNINFIYEKRVPSQERAHCDFYLPRYDLYIEFWGLESDNYIKRKKQKIKIYKKNRLNLLEMDDESLRNLKAFFEAKLSKFDVKTK